MRVCTQCGHKLTAEEYLCPSCELWDSRSYVEPRHKKKVKGLGTIFVGRLQDAMAVRQLCEKCGIPAFVEASERVRRMGGEAGTVKVQVPADRMQEVGEMLAHHESADTIKKAIEDGFAKGQFRAPESSGVAYMLAGDLELDEKGRITRQVYPGHYMFYANKVTNEQLGFTPDAGRQDATLPFVATIGAGGTQGLSYIITVPGGAHSHSVPDGGSGSR